MKMISIKINPDKEYVVEMRHKIKENGGYCPCALEKSQDTKCMCKEFREQEDGICRCGLYIKETDED